MKIFKIILIALDLIKISQKRDEGYLNKIMERYEEIQTQTNSKYSYKRFKEVC